MFTRIKNVSFGMQMLQKASFSLYFKNTVPRVSLCFTLSATANTVHACSDFARMQMYFKIDFSPELVMHMASGQYNTI
jgi:hypothetical protein